MAADPMGRSHRRYREARASYRAWCAEHGAPCWLCGKPIDYRLRRGPASFELDHAIPVSKGGPLLAWSNFRPSHRRCNGRRGNRPPTPRKLVTSRRW